jgi:hypothetical protein
LNSLGHRFRSRAFKKSARPREEEKEMKRRGSTVILGREKMGKVGLLGIIIPGSQETTEKSFKSEGP